MNINLSPNSFWKQMSKFDYFHKRNMWQLNNYVNGALNQSVNKSNSI